MTGGLPRGKLPRTLLEAVLEELPDTDPTILVPPGVGEDAAVIDLGDGRALVLKSDPITFATDRIGSYAVAVNANDIATTGAKPRWFLTTVLFPPGIEAGSAEQVLDDLRSASAKAGITLCGGHTEITDAVLRPVVIGMMAGLVEIDSLVDKRNLREGDALILTKSIAVEGTAVIAREFAERLLDLGMTKTEIDGCAALLDQIDVVPEAGIAVESGDVSALHDVTEGGLASAIDELGIAGGHRMLVELDRIPVYPETAKMARLLGLDPLGLIGSGSLLICCGASGAETLIAALEAEGIPAGRIGTVDGTGTGVSATREGRPTDWPVFDTDEITKLFGSA